MRCEANGSRLRSTILVSAVPDHTEKVPGFGEHRVDAGVILGVET